MLFKIATLVTLLAGWTANAAISGNEQASVDPDDYDGFGVGLFERNSKPMVLFYHNDDGNNKAYCLEFLQSYEANNFEGIGESENDESGSSRIQYKHVDWFYEQRTDNFEFRFSSQGEDQWDELNFTFYMVDLNEDGEDGEEADWAVKFDIAIRGYVWDDESDEDSKFILDMDMDVCKYRDSGDDDEEEAEEDEEEVSEEEADEGGEGLMKARAISFHLNKEEGIVTMRRRMQDDDEEVESAESDEGIDEENSKEYDLDAAQFIIEPTAEGEFGTVNATLTANHQSDSMAIVFDYFGSTLDMDPVLAMDDDKYSDAAFSLGSGLAFAIASFFLAFFQM